MAENKGTSQDTSAADRRAENRRRNKAAAKARAEERRQDRQDRLDAAEKRRMAEFTAKSKTTTQGVSGTVPYTVDTTIPSALEPATTNTSPVSDILREQELAETAAANKAKKDAKLTRQESLLDPGETTKPKPLATGGGEKTLTSTVTPPPELDEDGNPINWADRFNIDEIRQRIRDRNRASLGGTLATSSRGVKKPEASPAMVGISQQATTAVASPGGGVGLNGTSGTNNVTLGNNVNNIDDSLLVNNVKKKLTKP